MYLNEMENKQKDYDDFLNEHTGFSIYQVLLCVGAFSLTFTTAAFQQIAIFLSAVPSYRCSVPAYDNSNCSLSEDDVKNLTIPVDSKTQRYEKCLRYDVNVTSCDSRPEILPDTSVISCPDGYYYDYKVYGETTISEWNLVCDRSILDAVSTSLFFFGFFIGSWTYGPLSDWYGRKLPILIYCLAYVIVGVSITFIPIFEVYLLLKTIAGAATIACYISVFTYVNEIAPKNYRNFVSYASAQTATYAHAMLPGLAYALKNWRQLEFVISIMAIVFLPVYFFLQESPRWLLAVGREDEARKVVEKFVKSNKKSFNDEDWKQVIETEKKKIEANKTKQKYSLLDLFKQPRMRIVSLSVMFNWFTVSLVFYGLALNIGNLSGDPFVNSAINASIEFVGNLMIMLAPFVGKHILLGFSFLFCGVFCLASTACIEFAGGNDALSTVGLALAIIGKLGITGSFVLTYSTTTDMFPTVVRATAVSLGSMSARIGSIITPFTIEAQNQIPWLTQTIFGCLSILAFFTSIILPETENSTSLTSINEAESFYRQNMTLFNKLTRTKQSKTEPKSMEAISLDIVEEAGTKL